MPRLVFLRFTARREKKRRWAFWQRRAAHVFAWLRSESLEEARRVAETEMTRRGWRIVRVEGARWEPETAHPDFFVRRQQRIAARWGAHYFFGGISERELQEVESSQALRSRYAETEGVVIDPGRVPEELDPVVRVARRWAIGDDVERERFLASVPVEEKRAFVELIAPRFEAIEAYCDSLRAEVPVPEEVVLLDMLAETFTEVQAEIDEPPDGRQAP